jgi:hypothetical protein
MGNVEIVVPPGVRVDVEASSFLANVEERAQPSAAITRTLRITGRVALGNLEVATRYRGESRRDARRRRRWERRMRRRERRMFGPWSCGR